jgi:hypothetical protein
VKELDARQVSDNIQRASVKCIATFTGLGLKLYSGEDIPRSDDEKATPQLADQQEAKKPATRAAAKKERTAPADAAVGEVAAPASDAPSEFNGKEALLSLGSANPLDYADRTASMKAVKAGLEALGLSKGEDIKDKAMFANVVTTMITSWAKEKGITIDKSAMAKEVDSLRAICTEGTVEQAIQGVKVWKEGKQ